MSKIRLLLSKLSSFVAKFIAAVTFLWFTHCLGDYALQTKCVALFKSKSLLICFIHASIWTGVMLVGFYVIARLGLFWNREEGLRIADLKWYAFLIIGYILLFSHLFIDYSKIYAVFFPSLPDDLSRFNPFTQRLLFIDQALHILSIIMSYFVFGLFIKKDKKS